MYQGIIWSIWKTFYSSLTEELKMRGIWEDLCEEVKILDYEWQRNEEQDPEQALRFFDRGIRAFLRDYGYYRAKKAWKVREFARESI